MIDRLKSCPFCDGKFRINYRGAYEHDSKGCILNGLEIKNHKEVEQWNTRKPMDRIKEKLVSAAESGTTTRESGVTRTAMFVEIADAIKIIEGEI